MSYGDSESTNNDSVLILSTGSHRTYIGDLEQISSVYDASPMGIQVRYYEYRYTKSKVSWRCVKVWEKTKWQEQRNEY